MATERLTKAIARARDAALDYGRLTVPTLQNSDMMYRAILDIPAISDEPREASEAVRRCREAARNWREGKAYTLGDDMATAIDALPDTLPVPVLTGTWAWAVEQMRAGKHVRRRSWNESRHVEYDRGIVSWNIYGPSHGQGVPFKCEWEDVDATDWEVCPPPAPKLSRGDRVRWWRGVDSGTGTYWGRFGGLEQVTLCAIKGDEDEPHVRMVACDRVEKE